MRNGLMRALMTLTMTLMVTLALAAIGWAQGAPRGGGAAANAAPSVPHDPHDLSGVWSKTWRNLNLSDMPPPMTPEGQARFDANKPSYGPRAVPPALGNDPTGHCDPLGLVRNLLLEVSIYQMEILQTPKKIVQFFEWAHSYRIIWLDGRALPKDPEPTWMGYSVGRWEGDTLIVDSVGFDDRTWLDHFGTPHSDQMRLEERYRRLDRDRMEISMTLTDPKTFTKPWVAEKRISRLVANKELPELFCVPSEEESFNQRVRNPAGGVSK